MNNNLDLKDRRILLELDKNCRQTNSEIAKIVGLSKDSIAYRIKYLENKKILSGYRTIIDISKLGYIQHRVALSFIDINSKIIEEIVLYLKSKKGVWAIAHNEGEWDFAIVYSSKTSLEFYNLFEDFMNKFRNIVKDKLITELIKFDELERNYLVPEEKIVIKSKKIKNKESKINIDEMDLKILNILSRNARKKLIEIAKELNISSMLTLQRIKRLEQNNIILQYKADINVLELNRDYYGIKINLSSYSQKKEILKEIYSFPEMTAAVYSINGYDIEFDVEILGTKDYHRIINNLRDKFSSIREIKSIRTIKYYHTGYELE